MHDCKRDKYGASALSLHTFIIVRALCRCKILRLYDGVDRIGFSNTVFLPARGTEGPPYYAHYYLVERRSEGRQVEYGRLSKGSQTSGGKGCCSAARPMIFNYDEASKEK